MSDKAPVSISPTLSRRRFLTLMGMGTASALLSACTPLGRQLVASPTPQQIQLAYQDWRTDWFPLMAQEMLAQFHAQHPNISVFYVPDPVDVETALPAAMANGTGPDVFSACCSFFPVIAQQGFALDLRELVARDLDEKTLADWDQAQYRSLFRSDGLQYGLPKYLGALALYYNKDVFDEFGVDYPDGSWDHDDYLEAMRRLTHDRDGDGQTDLWGSMVDISWDRIQMHVNGWGGHFVDPEHPSRCLMGQPAALEAMEWLRARMWDDRVMPTPLEVNRRTTRQAFSEGLSAMVEDGSWALKDILANSRFRVGVAPFPAGPARRVTLATTDGFGIYNQTLHPEAAWELLKFLVSPDYGRAMARANFLQPARASLLPDWIAAIRTEYPEQTQGLSLEAFADGQLKGYSVTAEIFPNMADASRLAQEAWQEIYVLGQEPVTHMVQVAKEIEAAQQVSG